RRRRQRKCSGRPFRNLNWFPSRMPPNSRLSTVGAGLPSVGKRKGARRVGRNHRAERTAQVDRAGMPSLQDVCKREVQVTPVASEQQLRHYAWVTDNRAKVAKATNGKVAYIYLPDTSMGGATRFDREFYAQVGKEGAIIDE